MDKDKDKDAADLLLAEVQAGVLTALEDGKIAVNHNAGEAADRKLGGGTKGFRCSKYMGGIITAAKEDLRPMVTNESDFLRTAVQTFCEAWFKIRRTSAGEKVRQSMYAEKIVMSTLREESARRDIINRLKILGDIVHQYRLEGDIEEAIEVLDNWINVIHHEPNPKMAKKYGQYMRNAPEIMDVVRDASLRGIDKAKRVKEFLGGE